MKKIVYIVAVILVVIVGAVFLSDGSHESTSTEVERVSEVQLAQNEELTEPESLLGTKWQWKETVYADGSMLIPNSPESFVIDFATESRFSATTDCNNISGAYTFDTDAISFGQMISTKMACMETQETEFSASLSETVSYQILENGFLLELQSESSKMHFTRVE